jgi:hypothetical protein
MFMTEFLAVMKGKWVMEDVPPPRTVIARLDRAIQ